MTALVCMGGNISNSFAVTVGVKQGVAVNYHLDGNLFNPQRLKAKTKPNTSYVFDMQYDDDAAYPAPNLQFLQRNLDTVNSIYSAGGLVVNASKTEVLSIQQNTAVPIPPFTIGGEDLKTVESFKYLGSILSATCDTENEIQTRFRLPSSSFGKLSKRIFLNRDLTVQTKIKVYKAICLSILLFGSETWTLYNAQIRRLEGIHVRCLQTILNITWRDRIPQVTILQNASTISIESMIVRRQLRWRLTAVDIFEAARTNIRIERQNRRHERMTQGPVNPAQRIPCPTCGRICASEYGLRSLQRSHLQRN
ncbi:uncharacterized protein LOC143040574 [Oratosquilla oratoria]|uniref:uncharacterized protein LOC143040574 n=1 Tax=Oratosquilla oratoria TaxID=337810 RepID=UPI003F7613B0